MIRKEVKVTEGMRIMGVRTWSTEGIPESSKSLTTHKRIVVVDDRKSRAEDSKD